MTPSHQNEPWTFDQVAQLRHEVAYEEVAKVYCGPMSKHPVISVKAHPELIWVRPDMGVGSVANPVAFAVNDPPQKIPWRQVTRSLERGYLPIVTSSWREASLLHRQLAFATLLRPEEVQTGREKQVAMLAMSITNTHPSATRHATLWAFVPGPVTAKGVPPFPYNTYDLFDVPGDLPTIEGDPVEPSGDILRDGPTLLGTHSEDSGIRTFRFGQAWRFETALRPGEQKTIRLKVNSSKKGLSAGEIDELRGLDFLSALDRRVFDLEGILEQGTQIQVPEQIVNNIYKAQILYNQVQMVQAAERDYYLPVQGLQGVWPWEAMKALTPLDAMGYHEDVRKCLGYFLEIQGRFLPQGDFETSNGVFGGTIAFEESGWENDPDSTVYGQLARLNAGKEEEFPNWMNGTGAMLYAFGTHYAYTRDRSWLEQVAPALVRACDWIVRERRRTRQTNDEGQKVTHFGLLPVGRAYDTAEEAIRQLVVEGELIEGQMSEGQFPGLTYHPCWTDSYSWQGLERAAEALADIDHPEGKRLVEEAEAYRRDIQEVMRRTRILDRGLPPYPERLYRPSGWAEFATGALALVDTGLLNPHEAAFAQLEDYMKKQWNRGVLGLTGGLQKVSDPHGSNAFYVHISEDVWHRAWLLRGEVEKALLAFYSVLAYGVDKETFGSIERFHLHDPRYAPFFMDTSASSRICGLIRQALLLEDGKIIHLLPGVPRRWMEAGKKIELRNGLTPCSKLSLTARSETDQGRICFDLTLSELRPPVIERIRLRVPHPDRKPIRKALCDGEPWSEFNAEREWIDVRPVSGTQEILAVF